MRARMTPQEALRHLDALVRTGRSNPLKFFERNYIIQENNSKPIRFEPWQVEHVLLPVFRKINRRRSYNTYLIGLPKKNGKSTLASCVGVYALLLDDPYPEVYSTARDKDQARIIFNFTKKVFERSATLRPLVKIYKDVIERIDGNGFYRALASDSSGSHGLNPSCVIWDELWNQPDYSLWEALTHSPTRQNPFHFIVTYAGYQARKGNLLWDLSCRGLSGDDPRMYIFWRSGAGANLASWITPEYLEGQRRALPEHVYRRLHMNEWSVDESTKVFHIPQECWEGGFQDYVPGASYVAGIDLAKLHDFTAWAIIRTDMNPFRLVDFGKLPHIDYTRQVEILKARLDRFGNPKVKIDASAAGTAVIELMRQQSLNVEEFTFSNDTKARIVTDMVVAFQ
jgi:phage terminase large subunit-like protein